MFTFELKNSLTKQTAADAVLQYQRDRNPREKLFEFGRCSAHFAVDERDVQFCTQFAGKASWFLPFNRRWSDGRARRPLGRSAPVHREREEDHHLHGPEVPFILDEIGNEQRGREIDIDADILYVGPRNPQSSISESS